MQTALPIDGPRLGSEVQAAQGAGTACQIQRPFGNEWVFVLSPCELQLSLCIWHLAHRCITINVGNTDLQGLSRQAIDSAELFMLHNPLPGSEMVHPECPRVRVSGSPLSQVRR